MTLTREWQVHDACALKSGVAALLASRAWRGVFALDPSSAAIGKPAGRPCQVVMGQLVDTYGSQRAAGGKW